VGKGMSGVLTGVVEKMRCCRWPCEWVLGIDSCSSSGGPSLWPSRGGQYAFLAFSWGSEVYREYREPSIFQPVMCYMIVDRRFWSLSGLGPQVVDCGSGSLVFRRPGGG
jgi:hypothetical protein